MNIKKLATSLLILLCISLSMPAFSESITPKIEAASNPADKDPKADNLLLRLKEIKAMDMKSLSRAEKKDLRKEVKEIRKQMKASSKGIYLSVGAIIIIVLLLILLL